MGWTPQQEAVFAAVGSGRGHLCVSAVAGSGKTTTCVEAAKFAGGNVAMVAFNKHIAAELQQRLGTGASACTLHSLGFTACKRAWGSQLNEKKLNQLLQELKPRWFYDTNRGVRPTDHAKAAMDLARLCKYSLADGTDAQLDDLVEHHGLCRRCRAAQRLRSQDGRGGLR
jgi:DNA helicase II / ATP-dependent DNA helicase PcrA